MSKNSKQKKRFTSNLKKYKSRSPSKQIDTHTFEILVDLANKEGLNKTQLNKLIKTVATILDQDGNGLCFAPIPSKYWKKSLGAKYKEILDILEKNELIAIDHFYFSFPGKDRKKCKRFKITPKLWDSQIVKVTTKRNYDLPQGFIQKRTYRIIQELQLDFPSAIKWMEQYIEDEKYMERIKLDHEIKDKVVWLDAELNNRKGKYANGKYPRKKSELIEEAWSEGKSIIEDKRKFIKENIDTFKFYKEQRIKVSYLNYIYGFGIGGCHRNGMSRLYTPITNIPNGLFEFITFKNEHFVSNDLKNSQMLLLTYLIDNIINFNKNCYVSKSNPPTQLVHIINKYIKSSIYDVAQLSTMFSSSKSYKRFKEAAQKGVLYELIQEKLGLPSRSDAKIIMFEILFSKSGNTSENVKIFDREFPELYKFVCDFKKSMGNEELAISLQKIEAAIFIDVILRKLLKMGYTCLSKHDSILSLESDFESVNAIIKAELKKILGEFSLKVEWFNAKKGYGKTA